MENELSKKGRMTISAIIIIIGIILAIFFYFTKPKARRNKPKPQAPLVEVMSVKKGSHQIVISAMGTVVPSEKVALKSKLSGQIIETSPTFEPGGLFKKGEIILRIDPVDYELAVRNQESRVNRARADFSLEMGHQDVAREELKMLQTTSGKMLDDNALALRKPQLVKAEADLETARVALEQAKLNLERTIVRAPCNCIITTRSVSQGSEVTAQTELATLVGTDAYWIETTVPMDRIPWIVIPLKIDEKGSSVDIQTQNRVIRKGEVVRLLGELNSRTHMAGLLVRVDDPMGLKTPEDDGPLLLGSYVDVKITGKILDDVFPIPVSAVRDDGTLWRVSNGKMNIKKIKIIWKDHQKVYVGEGLTPDEKIVVSELSSPVEGMALRVLDKNNRVEKKNPGQSEIENERSRLRKKS